MEVKIWGARGSTPLSSVEMLQFGGNTSCIEVAGLGLPKNHYLLFDGGTGLRNFGAALPDPAMPGSYQAEAGGLVHIFITHVHLDHIIGLPFFPPMFSNKWRIKLYVPSVNKDFLSVLMNGHFFPVKEHDLESDLELIPLEGFDTISFPNFTVQAFPVPHPGSCFGYRVSGQGSSVCYVPDYEITTKAEQNGMVAFLQACSLAIMDSQYLEEEYASHKGWGHSTPRMSAELAHAAGVQSLLLFHHEPARNDSTLLEMEQCASRQALPFPFVFAREGAVYPVQAAHSQGVVYGNH